MWSSASLLRSSNKSFLPAKISCPTSKFNIKITHNYSFGPCLKHWKKTVDFVKVKKRVPVIKKMNG